MWLLLKRKLIKNPRRCLCRFLPTKFICEILREWTLRLVFKDDRSEAVPHPVVGKKG